jgi:uncharacterized protein (DUF1330 family)
MKPHYATSIALAVGLATGALVTTALRAQSIPPAYVVAEVAIHDTEGFARDYAPKIAGTLQPFGGQILTSGKLTALEGNTPPRFVIIAFDSVQKATDWYNSPEYKPLLEVRKRTATTTLFIAEGRPK